MKRINIYWEGFHYYFYYNYAFESLLFYFAIKCFAIKFMAWFNDDKILLIEISWFYE